MLKHLNLALRFMLELAALGALAYWGVRTGSALSLKFGLGAGLPVLAAVFWAVSYPRKPVSVDHAKCGFRLG
jgi:hypothetical protein